MFDNCFTYMLIGLLIIILLFNGNLDKNKNCILLLLVAIVIIAIMLIDNSNNNVDNNLIVDDFDPNILAPIEEINKPILSQNQNVSPSTNQNVSPSNNQNVSPSTNQNVSPSTNQQNNLDYTLNVNPNDPKYNTNTNEPRKALQAKDLLPGIVTDSKNKFDSFTDLFNYDKALELDIAENKLGIDTIQQSKRNASQDLREAPVCPKFNVGPWNNSTIQPDNNIKSLY